MQVHCFENAAQVGQAAALLLAAQVLRKPDSVLGLATGSSPIPTYQEVIRLHKAGILDLSRASTFNLDEYCALPEDHPCSYHYFMWEQLFAHVNLPEASRHLPDGNASDLQQESLRYDTAIDAAGGIDLQLLGIGHNAHIGFNEPDTSLQYATHVAQLTPSTIEANRRFFKAEGDVPRQAITMGIGSILKSRTVLLIATGEDKAEAIYHSLRGDINPQVPASMLRTHSDAIILLDKGAASRL